jgi:hypothetical protein
MTTTLGRIIALKILVDQQEAGGYTLPRPLLDAYQRSIAAAAILAPPSQAFAPQDAADQIVRCLTDGADPDLADLAQRVRHATEAGNDRELAHRILAVAAEMTQNTAVNIAADLADVVITDHLRPVFAANLERVAGHGTILGGYPLDTRALISAPAKVRSAWTAVKACADRHRLLIEARSRVNTAGLRQPQRDTTGMYAAFELPRALFPGLSDQARMPQLPFPADPVDMMLWLVGDAARAKPWLPTVDEQDAAWWAQHGEGVEKRRTGQAMAEAAVGGGPR